MTGPRDQLPQYGVPVNVETGRPLTEMQVKRLAEIRDTAENLYEAMHRADGSAPPGEHQEHTWSGQRMTMAAHYLELAVMLARKAALE